ncbi:MAG: SLBB domain-containing protein [Candidatus Latescibacteria bacterium]|nr:SLBB domain-containing protein [Candidatus Latescibacterota bacterium]
MSIYSFKVIPAKAGLHRTLVLIICACSLATVSPAFAQQDMFLRDTEREQGRRTLSASRALIPNLFNQENLLKGVVDVRLILPPLEQPISPATYTVGPGDNILVHIGGEVNQSYALTINPECLLVIPTIGAIDANGLTLSQVKERVRQRARVQYLKADITTALLYPRQFRVTVSGAVNNPGSFVATPVDRVSEVLYQANRPTEVQARLAADRAFVLPSTRASDRNIEIRRRDGTVIASDLLRYLATGLLDHNPRLLDGDVIFVPVRNLGGGNITVAGAVNSPGQYEYAEGDRLGTLLDLAGGLTFGADRTRVEVSRFHVNSDSVQTVETIPIDLTQGQTALNTPLHPRDRIFVRTALKSVAEYQVTVKGEVRYPGTYPISSDGMALSQIINAAGGVTPSAFLKGASVIRASKTEPAPANADADRVAKMRLGKLSQQERADFEVQTTYRREVVVVDFKRLFNDHDPSVDIVLQDGDTVVIPSKNETVSVIGQVVSPGQVPYEAGQSYQHYIQQAGGFGTHAQRRGVRVIKAQTYEWLPPDRTPVDVGDTIWVPRPPQRNYFAIFKETLQVMATLTTLYLVIQQIAR